MVNAFTLKTFKHKVIIRSYVDDMLILKREISDINATKHILESNFDMKDISYWYDWKGTGKVQVLGLWYYQDSNKCELCTLKERRQRWLAIELC